MRNLSKNTIEISSHISDLFASYGRSDDLIRIRQYVLDLNDLPSDLVQQACKVLRLTSKFLPAISDVINTCRHIYQSLHNSEVKSWPDALLEINTQTKLCGIYGKPHFTTPEIAKTINIYGWQTWCLTPDNQIGYAQTQLQKIYELICNEKIKQNAYKYVLEKKPIGLLGYNEVPKDNMSCISDTIILIKERK